MRAAKGFEQCCDYLMLPVMNLGAWRHVSKQIIWHYNMAPLSLHGYFSKVLFLSCNYLAFEVWKEIENEVNAEISAI